MSWVTITWKKFLFLGFLLEGEGEGDNLRFFSEVTESKMQNGQKG